MITALPGGGDQMTTRNRTRRILAAVALVLSSAALVATSPPTPPINSLEARAVANATLTSDSPLASTVVTFSASDEALWSDDPEIRITTATLVFSATGQWVTPVPATGQRSHGADQPIIRLTAVPLDREKPLEPLAGRLTYASVDPRNTCPANRDCQAQFELLVEWIDPSPGLEVNALVEATSLVQIQGPETLPVSARTRLGAEMPVAVEVPVVSDGVDGHIVVDAAHPLAMWSVVIDADAGAIAAPLAWPVESRGSFVATVTQESGQPLRQFDKQGLSIFLIPEAADEIVPEIGGGVRHAFDPFSGCLPETACHRQITVVVRWFAADPTFAATVDWRLDSGIVYHGDVHPAPDADVHAEVDGETVVTDEGPVITASAEGVVTLDSSDAGISERRGLELEIPQVALASDLLGGPVPALTGSVSLQARSSAAVQGDPLSILASWEPAESFAREGYQFPDPQLNGGALDIPVFPAPACRADGACNATMTLGFGLSANDTPRLEGVGITVTWRVEVRLQYPPGRRPPAGAALTLRDVQP
jgi:hypothetical protein